ncbi:MAG: TIR domain-containing protein [Gammaproteobacteria bacterium]|nr:TIR domain-containing protein [Gammaproteobacteria bacterium]MDH4310060.1 TIR domain-containing protein [Gammaproteobacteria bacterium]MDH5272688.1 TIR domain-containing protein [Gammaproteobacteria bacterium]
MAQTADVFLSYSREDKARVLEFAGKLRAAGVNIWIDQGGIDGAALWGESIVRALEGAKVLLLMVSPSAVSSHNVAKEVMLTSERKGNILPVHLEPTTIPLGLKYPLAGIQHIEFYHGDPEENLQAVLRSLTGLGVTIMRPQPAAGAGAETRPAPAAAAHAADSLPERGAVAVLPFDNISPDPETDYFSDGLTEELIARLSLVSEINLISRWASMQHKGRGQDVLAIGNALGARYIVGGGVRRFQDSVRITVQLVDVVTNLQLWGNTYKGKLDDIFDIQEQVAQQIVEALKLKLTFSERLSLTKRQTLNAEAYDLYLRGQDQLYRLTKRSVEYAIQLFEKAIELDSRYASAYAGCSSAYGQMYQLIAREERYRELAQELSFKALMYDNNLSEAYRAMGLSYFLWGKLNEATASCTKAIEIDPDDFIAHWTLGRIYFTEGKLEQALDLFRRVAEIKPSFYAGHLDVAQTCAGLGRDEEAATVYRRLLEIMPNYLLQNPDDARARLIYASKLGWAGRKEEAIREGAKALVLSPGDPVMLYNAACMYVGLGESSRAIDALRQAVEAGYTNFGWMQNDPDLVSLRDDPAFIEMLRDLSSRPASPSAG